MFPQSQNPMDAIAAKYGGTPIQSAPQTPTPEPAATPAPQGSTFDNFSQGVFKGVAKPLLNASGFMQSGLDQTLGRVVNAVKGNGFTPTKQGQQAFDMANSPLLKPQGTAQQVGDVVGTVAPYLFGGEMAIPARFALNTALGTAQSGSVKQGLETGVGGEVLGALGPVVRSVGKTLYKSLSVPTSAIEAKLIQAYRGDTPVLTRIATAISGDSKAPITAAETAFQKGLAGTESMLGVQARKATGTLWNSLIAPALKRSPVQVDMPAFFARTAAGIKADVPELTRQGALLNALEAIKEDYAGVTNKSLTELQKFKEGWAKFVPEKAYKGQPIAGTVKEVQNLLASQARDVIYKTLGPDVRKAYLDYGNLLNLQEFGQKAMTGQGFRGGTGGLINSIKDSVLTPIATIGGQTIYKVGQGMQFIGGPGAHYLSDIFNGGSPSSTSPQETPLSPQSTGLQSSQDTTTPQPNSNRIFKGLYTP